MPCLLPTLYVLPLTKTYPVSPYRFILHSGYVHCLPSIMYKCIDRCAINSWNKCVV